MADVLVIGTGRHAGVVIELLEHQGHCVVGLCGASRGRIGERHHGKAVVTCDEDLEAAPPGWQAVVAIGDNRTRQQVFVRCRTAGMRLLSAVVHESAFVSGSAVLGPGTVILPRAVVHTRARVGANSIVNTAAVIEHDCIVEDHAHVAPGATLGGSTFVGTGALVGIGASVTPGLTIGAWATVGAGAAAVRDVPEAAVVAGVPARPLSGSN